MKKRTRTMAAALLALAMLLPLAGCGGEDPAEQAQAAVTGMFTALRAADFDTAGKYVDTEELIDVDMLAGLPGEGKAFLNGILGDLQHEILSAQPENNETVYVTTKVSAVDMKPILNGAMEQLVEYVLAHIYDDPAPTEEDITAELMRIFDELLSADELDMVTSEVLIKVVKAEGGWRIETADELVDAVLGGMEQALEDLEQAFSS